MKDTDFDTRIGKKQKMNPISAASFLVAALATCSTSIADISTGLRSSYRLDRDNADSSGAGLHGTLVGTPTFVISPHGQGVKLNGTGDWVEIGELLEHPWFLAVQFHPELKSRPTHPHPLFRDFVGACMNMTEPKAKEHALAKKLETAIEE